MDTTIDPKDNGPSWICVKMTDERRGLWFRRLYTGELQVRAGREGDDAAAVITGDAAESLAQCLSYVACRKLRVRPHLKFAELVNSRAVRRI